MVIVFPLALLVLSPVSDIVGAITRDAFWSRAAFWLAFLGTIAAIVAAVPGFIDWLAVPGGTRAKRVGVIHLAVNLTAVALFVISVILRFEHGADAFHAIAFVLALVGALVVLVGGWFGGELVERLGVGIWSDAHLDAPSSFDAERLVRREHAREPARQPVREGARPPASQPTPMPPLGPTKPRPA